jgi:hypothetical protein
MALIKCKECGTKVSKKADSCPSCGSPVKRRPMGCGTALVIVGIALFIAFSLNTSDPENKEKPVVKKEAESKKSTRTEEQEKKDQEAFLVKVKELKLFDFIENYWVSDWILNIEVNNTWHITHHKLRLQAAEGLWKTWVNIRDPKQPKKCIVRIVDQNNIKVGGSNIYDGSMISVEK